jgi:type IV secretory pathway VirB4 component
MPIYNSDQDLTADVNVINNLFDELTNVTIKSQTRREKLLSKLDSIIDNLYINDNDKASNTMAKVSVISVYKELLNDTENSTNKLLNTHMRRKENENTADTAKDIVEFLQKLQHNKFNNAETIDQKEQEILLQKKLQENNIEISKHELKESAYDFDE